MTDSSEKRQVSSNELADDLRRMACALSKTGHRQHLAWKAADEIECLNKLVTDLRARLLQAHDEKHGASLKMSKLYASLMGPLVGVYYPLPFNNEGKNRIALNTSRLQHLWCSVYTRKEVEAQIERFGGLMLPDKFVHDLDYDSHAVDGHNRA